VKPLVNLNLIFVYLFGFLILQEKIHLCEGFGLGCIIIGAVIISLKAEPSLTQVNLSALIHLSWITVAVIVFSFYVLKKNKVAFEFGGSMICGILYGLGSLYNKALYASGNSVLLKVIFLSLFGLSYFFAFLTGQTAYLKGRMSIVSTFVNIMSIVTPFIGGVILFGESFVLSSELVFFRWSKVLGLILIIIGIILNYPHQEDDSDA
jgi:drug/metabolite transporter (DMT)-like permease